MPRSEWTKCWTKAGKLSAAKKAHAKVDKKLKESLAHLTEAERAKKNVEAALASYEK